MMPSRRIAAVAVAAQLAVSAAALAQVAPGPSVQVQIDGQAYPVPVVRTDGKVFSLGADGQGAIIETPGAVVVLSGALDPDPSAVYGLTVTDLGAPSSFSLLISFPIVPTVAPADVVASLVGGLTDATGDGVSLTPTAPFTQVATLGAPSTNMGVDVGTALAVPATGIPGSVAAYGPFDSGLLPAPGPGPWTTLSVSASFALSGNGDVVALTGSAAIIPIPSPAIGLPGAVFLLSTLRPRRR